MANATVIARRQLSIATDQNTNASNASDQPVITVPIDVVKTEQHEGSNTITDHPVEEGFNVSDHSRPDPDTVRMDCLISNTPLSLDQQARAISAGGVTFQSTAVTSGKIGAVDGRAQQAYDRLKQLKDSGTLVTVVTTLKTYTSMGIQSLSVARDSKTYDALAFTITLKQVRVVKNKLTRTVVSRDKRVGANVKTGAKTPQKTEVEQSAAAKMYDGAKDKNGFMGKLGGALGAVTE